VSCWAVVAVVLVQRVFSLVELFAGALVRHGRERSLALS
jgi:hypothetical protein